MYVHTHIYVRLYRYTRLKYIIFVYNKRKLINHQIYILYYSRITITNFCKHIG